MEIIGSSKHDHHDHDHEIINNNDNNKGGVFSSGCSRLKVAAKGLRDKGCEIVKKTKKVGEDDPRRVIHSVKVGSALSLVSLFYYYQPLYDNFGVSAMWAIMTVVVVFEFSVGATLGKGLNRGLATLLAGALGIGAHHLASLTGQIGEPVLLGFFVFLQAASSTFIRFFPKIKARYDYGMLIFILTFCLISVSGFRNDEILEMAHQRLSTILIGGFACVAISIFVCPVWAGEDLHNLIALNLEKLGNFLEGFGDEYFNISGNKDSDNNNNKDLNKAFLQGYKSVLNSKSSEESLANFAKWEPGHGRFKYRHPWDQYLKVGNLARQCAYRIEALHTRLLNPHDLQVSAEVKGQIKEACTQISSETGKTLKELSSSVKKMVNKPSSIDNHTANSKMAAKSLRSLLKSGLITTKNDPNDSNNNNNNIIIVNTINIDLLEVIPSVTVASILLDVVNCTELIAESVHELASLARFKSTEKSTLGKSDTASHVEAIVTIAESAPTSQVINSNGTTTPRIGVSVN